MDVVFLHKQHDEEEVQCQAPEPASPDHAPQGFDTDVKEKALIFDEDEIKTFMLADMESAYWLVRQAITIVVFFGELGAYEYTCFYYKCNVFSFSLLIYL